MSLKNQFENDDGEKQSNHAERKSNDSSGINIFNIGFSIFHKPPIQPADKLMKRSERVRYQAGSIFIAKANLAVAQIGVNQNLERSKTSSITSQSRGLSERSESKGAVG